MKKHPLTENFISNFRELLMMALPMIVYCTIYLIWWHRLESVTQLHYTVIHSPVDDMIPFYEIFVVPYVVWFGYCLYVVLYFLFKREKEDYIRVLAFLGVGMTLFLVISALFPNMLQLRPRTFARDNLFTHLTAYIYAHDTATNVFPSIHVYNAIGCHLAICNSERFAKKGRRISFVICVSIILSTMFLKQHSVYDVMGAMALAVVMDYVIYRTSLVKLIYLSHEFIAADRNKTPALAGEIDEVSESGKAHF